MVAARCSAMACQVVAFCVASFVVFCAAVVFCADAGADFWAAVFCVDCSPAWLVKQNERARKAARMNWGDFIVSSVWGGNVKV